MVVVQYDSCKQLRDILLGGAEAPQHPRKEFPGSPRNGTSLTTGF